MYECRMKELRKAKGLSQEKLAELCNIHPVSISNYEDGRNLPNIRVLFKMAEVLGCKYEDIYREV